MLVALVLCKVGGAVHTSESLGKEEQIIVGRKRG